MKKAALLFAFLLIAFLVEAQQFPTNPETGKIVYTEVVPVEGSTQKELYTRARAWVATSFNSAPAVLQMDTEDKIVIKGIQNYSIKNAAGYAPAKMHFTMVIEFKDGRYKYETTDFSTDGNEPIELRLLNPKVIYNKEGQLRTFNRNMVEGFRNGMVSINESLKKAMVTIPIKSDW